MSALRTAKERVIEVPPIVIGAVKIKLIGDSVLCLHAWSHKAIRQMLDKQMGKAQQRKAPKDPTEEFLGALHVMPGAPEPVLHKEPDGTVWAEGEFGFRACGLKAAIIRAATDANLHMTDMRRALRVPGDVSRGANGAGRDAQRFQSDSLIRIQADRAWMGMDMVRLSSSVADVRFRPVFTDWWANAVIKYNKSVLNLEQVVNLVKMAGFGVGIGEWRPERGGEWGTFTIDPNIEALPDEIVEVTSRE
jgi:hypothetical protein